MEIMTVAEDGMMPERQHASDAGADLRAAETTEVEPGEVAMAPTGVRCAIPEGYVGLLFSRSSLCRKGLLMANGVGVIDSGYTGEIKVPLAAFDGVGAQVGKGERIAQILVLECKTPTFVQVGELPETERGDGGFGSTGSGAVAESATAEAPKCLDYDGVPIKPGDTVYAANIDGAPLGSPKRVVCTVNRGGELSFEYVFDGDAKRHEGYPGSHTHREPDGWEKLRSDLRVAILHPCHYANPGGAKCTSCRFNSPKHCTDNICDELMARAKRLAGVAE